MASGVFARQTEDLLNDIAVPDGTNASELGVAAPDGGTTELTVFLYPAANAPSIANIGDNTIDTVANLNTATSGAVEDASHDADVGTRTVGVAADHALDAPDTVITNAVTSANLQDVGLAVRLAGGFATTARVVAYFDVSSPVTPNGEDITVVWAVLGILQYGIGV